MQAHPSDDDGLPEPKEYPLKAWLQDCDWYFEATKQWPTGLEAMGTEPSERHFSETRTDTLIANYCFRRFLLAVSFLQEHAPKLDFGKALVIGTRLHLVSKHMVVTLYRFFAAIPDQALGEPVPVDVFIDELRREIDESG